jgi:hypothetical protein
MTDEEKRVRDQRRYLFASAAVILIAALLPMPSGGTLTISGYDVPEICFFKRTIDFPCPGCGVTRSFVAMGHLQPAQAYDFNRIGPLFFLFFLIQIPYRWWMLQPDREVKGAGWTLPVLMALLILNYLFNLWQGKLM